MKMDNLKEIKRKIGVLHAMKEDEWEKTKDRYALGYMVACYDIVELLRG